MKSMEPAKIDQLSVSKSLSLIENNTHSAREMIGELPERDYCVIGITGSTGGRQVFSHRPSCVH